MAIHPSVDNTWYTKPFIHLSFTDSSFKKKNELNTDHLSGTVIKTTGERKWSNAHSLPTEKIKSIGRHRY